jgi:hypothetical protein
MPAHLHSITFEPTEDSEQLDLTLQDLAMVNIVVGANGSGKSRLIRGLGYNEARQGRRNSLKSNLNIPNYMKIKPDGIKVITTSILQFPSFEFDNQTGVDIDSYRLAVNELSIGGISDHEIENLIHPPLGTKRTPKKESLKEIHFNGIPIVRGTDKFDTALIFSSGTKRLANLYEQLDLINFTYDSPEGNISEKCAYIILVDELEIGLHPRAQRKALRDIVDFAQNGSIRNGLINAGTISEIKPVQVFITTHSPFLVSAASEYNSHDVKVYLLKDGKTSSVNGQDGGESGYGGTQSLFAANWMLGAEQKDYIPDSIILAEDSIQQFLKASAQAIGCSICAYQASTSGDGTSRRTAQNLLQLARDQLAFGNSKPWKSVLSFNVIVLLDGEPNGGEKAGWEKLKTNSKTSFQLEIISKDEFEEVHPPELVAEFLSNKGYPKWDTGNFKDFSARLPHIQLIASKSEQAREVGQLKCELAIFVGKRMTRESLVKYYPALSKFIV